MSKVFGMVAGLLLVALLGYTFFGGPLTEMPARPCRFMFNIATPVIAGVVGAVDVESEQVTRSALSGAESWCTGTVYAITVGNDWHTNADGSSGAGAEVPPPKRARTGDIRRSVEMPGNDGILLARPETIRSINMAKSQPSTLLPEASAPVDEINTVRP